MLDPADEGNNSESETDDPLESAQVAKRPKKLPEFTAYVDIISPPRTVRGKETSTTRGPFFFNANTAHLEFLALLAACTVEPHFSASISAILQAHLYWKLNVPANDRKKPLPSEQGYRALLKKMDKLSGKNKDCTVTLSMPPLAKIAETRTNGGPNGSQGRGNTEVEEVEGKGGPLGTSIREQKAVIDPEISIVVDRLREMYPIGNDLHWPDDRVVTVNKSSWKLNDIRLRIWASKIIDKPPTATYDAPPTSSYFTESQKIRNPGAKGDLGPDPVPPPLNPYPGPAPVAPMPYGYPPYALPPPFYPQPPYAYPPYALGYPQPPFQLMDPRSHASVRPHTPGAHGPGSAPTSPIKILLPYPVSLDEFCERYEIDDEDKGWLAKLKFQPGDRRVENLNARIGRVTLASRNSPGMIFSPNKRPSYVI
ncbi:hypothetical protein HYPSUDRAFT_213426 [Hypholoma sublateritium FD-334 SS-4]|uniref:Uncharacterized protein n=1 Tax=Hypholoma sublateritium (strain FD-334 SS-4) TaxID=945553 RepID=A0A0D2P4R6_HYPSF|nr:hypothetical protein HYPSUDRAFT_213426 [Hypholoma sublateritium FD-334 SS-4]